MIKLLCCVGAASLLGACSSAPVKDTETAYNEMPEYRTGSIIAKKKSALSDNVKDLSPAELEKVRESSSLPIR
jgi:hypothetical protein